MKSFAKLFLSFRKPLNLLFQSPVEIYRKNRTIDLVKEESETLPDPSDLHQNIPFGNMWSDLCLDFARYLKKTAILDKLNVDQIKSDLRVLQKLWK